MELRQLLHFTTLAETLNFHRAADQLNMTQPPLSVSIRKLEEELGVSLFQREPRGVSLTHAGRAALAPARVALLNAKLMRKAADDGARGERGTLRMSFVGSATYELMPDILPRFREKYPRVALVLHESNTSTIVNALLACTIDIGLVRLPLLEAADIDVRVLRREELVVAIPESDDRAGAERLCLTDFAKDSFIIFTQISIFRLLTISACHAAGFAPKVAQEVSSLSALLCFVRSGLGVALVPSSVENSLPHGVRLVKLANPPQTDLGLALPKDSELLALNLAELISN